MAEVNNYVLAAGRVYVGQGFEERYVGASASLDFTLDVETLATMKSENGVLIQDEVHIISAKGSLSLQLESISQENLAIYFGSGDRWDEFAPRRLSNSFTARRGSLIPLAEGGFIRTKAYIGDIEIDVARNFEVDTGFGVVIGRNDAPDLIGSPVVRFVTDCGRSVSRRIGSTFSLYRGSLRYVEQNAYGANRMFFFPEATFVPEDTLSLKDDSWRKLSMRVEVTSVPRIMEQARCDDYGHGAPSTVGNNFGTPPYVYNDDYGVNHGG